MAPVPNLTLSPKPPWLKKRLRAGSLRQVRGVLRQAGLHTVCEAARCPNIAECFGRHTATFLILGDRCTRACTFCSVEGGRPAPVAEGEAERLAAAARRLGLRHVVVTSVTRDDLPDGGAKVFAEVVAALHRQAQTVEVLTPDFLGEAAAIDRVAAAGPEIYGHNVETVPRLYRQVRPQADYRRSLALLRRVKEGGGGVLTKSGLMVGLGEREAEVVRVMADLRDAGCDLLTVGQYLAPGGAYHPVVEYLHPDRFDHYREVAEGLGFLAVASGPFVRSSYNADRVWERLQSRRAGARDPEGGEEAVARAGTVSRPTRPGVI
jgi:lipoic acid synthetase